MKVGVYLRLDRYLANMGCGSRSAVKKLLRAGQVTVNDQIIRDDGYRVAELQDKVTCWGEVIRYREFIYLMLNKPAGVISATDDDRERTVLDLLDPKYRNKGIFPVGRLDKDTEGLLVLTNNGELGHQLLTPRKHVPKYYLARVTGAVGPDDFAAFRDGVLLDDGYRTLPAELELLQSGELSEVRVIIHEGKFHQIKRMFQALDKKVVYLKRIAMGELCLDPALELGEYRELSDEEIAILMRKDFSDNG
ncbi:MAG TPA: 16S rRNA pseudouridine(516) synthase [Firmicutes bacterium]|nr:16S rRNA pseudouridine(516) synthase [Bacillota bacterium]